MDFQDEMEVLPMDDSYHGASRGRENSAPKSYFVPVIFDKEEAKKKSEKTEAATEEDLRRFGCIVSESERPELEEALKVLGMEVCYSSNGRKMPDYVPDECKMVFVCEEFTGSIYDYLNSHGYKIIGPPCVKSCAVRGTLLPTRSRSVYCNIMEGVSVCFTGFKEKEQLQELCNLVHLMGGSVNKKMSANVTHLVAHTVFGTKYKDAVVLGTPIMSEQWIRKCWEERLNTSVTARAPHLMVYKQCPFIGCVIALHGFADDEADHVRETAALNGAVNCSVGDGTMTHLIVAHGQEPQDIPATPSKVFVVRQQWFWESIQIEACAEETIYLARERKSSRKSHKRANASLYTSIEFSLLEASICSLASPSTRSSLKQESKVSPAADKPTMSPKEMARHHIVSELLQTESNFVEILNTIVTVFKEPLEAPPVRGGPLLNSEELKSIFGNIADILRVHRHILSSLKEKMSQWTAESCVGHMIVEQSEELQRVYPPFVNYFEMAKETLNRCNKQYPRFHAFLKLNESLPECGRQTLAELLITPVQRIPRIILLLQDLVKHTDPAHSDHTQLKNAVAALKTVMTHINEDKRKTEGQMQMFEVLRDVEDCPAIVLSSDRTFLKRLDVVEANTSSSGGGVGNKKLPVSLFIFSDSIEITKRRAGHGVLKTTKQYKHLHFLRFSHIRSVVDFSDGEGVFGLLVKSLEDACEQVLVFRTAEDMQQQAVVNDLAKLLAQHNCSTMLDNFIFKSSMDDLNSLAKPRESRSFRKALHGARKRVKRVFSSRSSRKPLEHISGHSNALAIPASSGDEAMEDSFCYQEESALDMSTTSASFTVTPLSVLCTPRPKRPALSYSNSMSSADFAKINRHDN